MDDAMPRVVQRVSLFLVSIALCGCLASVFRPPPISPDGVVECTDNLRVPIGATIVASLSVAAIFYAKSNPDFFLDHGGPLWAPEFAPDLTD
jgi:hypothetical protein